MEIMWHVCPYCDEICDGETILDHLEYCQDGYSTLPVCLECGERMDGPQCGYCGAVQPNQGINYVNK